MVHGSKKGSATGSNNSMENNPQSPQQAPEARGGGGPSAAGNNGGLNGNSSNTSSNGGGGNARQTGTVPKTTRASRKHSVPQEIVAPTRRDLQHLTELVHWASTAPSSTNSTIHSTTSSHNQQQQLNGGITGPSGGLSKQRNVRTPGGTCFDLDNLSLQEHHAAAAANRFIPVRPIVRGSYLAEDLHADPHLLHSGHSNTAIGVVIPTTPNQQQQDHQAGDHPIWQQIINPLASARQLNHHQQNLRQGGGGGGGGGGSARQGRSTSAAFRIIPDGGGGAPLQQQQQPSSSSSRHSHSSRGGSSSQRQVAAAAAAREALNSSANRQLDDRILEIQDYIRATSSLIDTINSQEKISGPRPQSVASIHSTPTPETPDYDADLQQKLQNSNRNMQMIRDQQNQILRLQQAAKNQLEDLEKARQQHANQPTLLNQGGDEAPNYQDVNQVQDDVSTLMNRMRSLTSFIENQNDLASLLGEDLMTDEILAEQQLLQKKLQDLKAKRGQMADLVSELQNMNDQADQSFAGSDMPLTPLSQRDLDLPVNQMGNSVNRIVPMALERIVPIEILDSNGQQQQQQHHPIQNANSGASISSQGTLMNCNDLESEVDNNDSELYDSESLASGQNNNMISEKLAEINAMKEQLKRLQNMMSTVKLIENKVNGPDPLELAEATREVDRLINEIPQARKNVVVAEKPQQEQPRPQPVSQPQAQQIQQEQPRQRMSEAEMEPILSDRVQALHAMTADLRAQALSLASERDRLRVIKDEMVRRKAAEEEERESERSNSTIRESVAGAASLNYNRDREASEQRRLKDEYEQKKREYEKVLEKMQTVGGRAQSQPRQMDIFAQNDNQESGNNGLSKKMQNDQLSGYNSSREMASAPVHTVPWRRASSITTQIHPGNGNGGSQQMPTQQQMSATIAQLQNHQAMFQQQTAAAGSGNNVANYQQEQSMFLASNNGNSLGDGMLQSPFYRGDSLLLQQFIQTQQMLINSISQCNQLLWAQQRELNNLNNAVLMLQERLLKHELSNTVDSSLNMSGSHPTMMNNRSESVPPANVAGLLATAGADSNLLTQGGGNLNSVAYLRAQSEQPAAGPFFSASTASANFGNAPQTPMSPVRIYPMFNNQSLLRNGGGGQQSQMQANSNNLIHLNNNLGSNNTNNLTNNLNQFNNQHNNLSGNNANLNANLNNITNNLANNRIGRVAGNVPPHMQQQQQASGGGGPSDHHLFGNNILNLNPLNNNLNSNGNANLDHLPPIHHHFAGHHPVSAHNLHSHLLNQQPPTLNNQVAPGNRANNYWDNFRSYSRQNLLSGNSCKSNEESCASSTSNYQQSFGPAQQQLSNGGGLGGQPPHQHNAEQHHHRSGGSTSYHMHSHPNQHQQHLHQSSVQQVMDGKGFQQHFRNTLMDLHQQQHHSASGQAEYGLNNNYPPPPNLNNNNLNNIVNNLCRNNNNLILDNLQHIGGTDEMHPQAGGVHAGSGEQGAHGTTTTCFPNMSLAAADILGFHTNPINLGVNEAMLAGKSKTLPKGNKKRPRAQNMTNNTGGRAEGDYQPPMTGTMSGNNSNSIEGDNLNLANATSINNARSKSTSKFFESLKENVFMEVSALIETNDLRPYFLIQLFRDLQLMSSSDPTRHHTLQSIQNLYNRYVESTIQEEVSMFAPAVTSDQRRSTSGGGGGGNSGRRGSSVEEDRLNMSQDDVDNRMLVNDLRMEAKTENEPVVQRRGRDNQLEESLRRQNKRRYRNRLNEIAKQNFIEQQLGGFGFPTSSASSHSTPIRSVFNDMIQMVNGGDGSSTEQYIPPATSSSDSSSISTSTDCEIVRIVVKEIAEYVQSIEPINTITEVILQRIATIIISHLNNSLNERLVMTNYRRIDREELMVQLRMFSMKRNRFLKRIEQYLQSRFVDSPARTKAEAEEGGNHFRPGRDEPAAATVGVDHQEAAMMVTMMRENQEVLLNNNEGQERMIVVVPKKQNNNHSAGPGGVPQTADSPVHNNSAIDEQPEVDGGEEGGAAEGDGSVKIKGSLEDFNGIRRGEREIGMDGAANGDQPNNEVIEEDRGREIVEEEERDSIWVTDEEVEILSTNGDGSQH